LTRGLFCEMIPIMKIKELAKLIGCHPDTLYKAKRKKCASRKLAIKLEEITGISRFCFLDPEQIQFPNGWDKIGN